MDEIVAMLRTLLSRGSVQAGYAASVLVLVPLTIWLAGHARWSRPRIVTAGLGAAVLAVFPALTLSRRDWSPGTPDCVVDLIDGLAGTGAEQVLNLVVLAPAGLLFGLALRRASPVVVAALVLSTGVESVQAVLGTGTCQTLDIARNGAGATLAAVLGAVLGRWWAGRDRPEDARSRSQRAA